MSCLPASSQFIHLSRISKRETLYFSILHLNSSKIPLFMGISYSLAFFSPPITVNTNTHFFQALTVAPSMHFFYPLCFWKMCWLSPTIDAYLPKGQSIPRELKQIQFYTNSIAINATSPAWLSLGHKAVTMDEAHVIKRHLCIPFSFS